MISTSSTENVTLTLPGGDISLLRSLSKKMGWIVKIQKKSGIEKGLEDIRKGNVYKAKNSDDLIKQMKIHIIYDTTRSK